MKIKKCSETGEKYGSGKNPACLSFSNEVKNPGKGGFCFLTVLNTCPSFLNEVKNQGKGCKIYMLF